MNNSRNETNRSYSRIVRLNRIFINSGLKTVGLSSGTYPFIMELYEKNGLSLNELSSSVCVDSSYTTRTLDKLIRLKLVEKKTNQKDLRALQIYLTEKGKKTVAKIKDLLDQWTNIIFEDFTEEEVASYAKLLDKAHANASKYFINSDKYADNGEIDE